MIDTSFGPTAMASVCAPRLLLLIASLLAALGTIGIAVAGAAWYAYLMGDPARHPGAGTVLVLFTLVAFVSVLAGAWACALPRRAAAQER